MKKYYTVGEVSKILGISSQTLRYYDKIGVVKPANVDEITGYRRYSYDQINYVDRVRYLQELGLSLEKIRQALEEGSIERLISSLKEHKEKLQRNFKIKFNSR